MADEEKKEEHFCDQCGKPATHFGPDPYGEELYSEKGPYPDEWWCDECYQERIYDI